MIRLVIANKNYSSWSLRSWLLLRQLDVEFEEIMLKFGSDAFEREIGRYSPARRVPVLLDGDRAVWDTLAIAEYVAERFPERGVWPGEGRARSRARSICAEMHSSFQALRGAMPMNVSADLPHRGWNLAVQHDIDRITSMWQELLLQHGGPFLFGRFCAADAFYAPVVSRFRTYAVALPPPLEAYQATVLALPAMTDWVAAGAAEPEYVAQDEPYRSSRHG
jgi:glutathione S-transferase